jgi:hypothetical protein
MFLHLSIVINTSKKKSQKKKKKYIKKQMQKLIATHLKSALLVVVEAMSVEFEGLTPPNF